MKTWLYLPLLAWLAVTYTTVSENYTSKDLLQTIRTSRGPASVEVDNESACFNEISQFNTNYIKRKCDSY
jgi:hypothetical protein